MSDSMEVQLLKQMMAEREARIEVIKIRTSFLETKEKDLRQELLFVKDERETAAIDQQAERLDWNYSYAEEQKKLDQLSRDMQQQAASLQKYAEMVSKLTEKQQANQTTDSSYVMQMQAQLCKAMHSLGITDHQLELAKQHAAAINKQLRDDLVRLEEERTKMELHFMNELVKEDIDTRAIETEFKQKLEEIQKEIGQLEDDLDEKSKGSDDDDDEEEKASENEDDDEEDDEEMKEAKQELMNMLHEQKDKIAELEQANEKQKRRIAQLQRRIDNPDASSELFSPSSEDMGMSYDETEMDDDEEEEDDDDDETESNMHEKHHNIHGLSPRVQAALLESEPDEPETRTPETESTVIDMPPPVEEELPATDLNAESESQGDNEDDQEEEEEQAQDEPSQTADDVSQTGDSNAESESQGVDEDVADEESSLELNEESERQEEEEEDES